jgi:K+-sensing histidine kinase KdpD
LVHDAERESALRELLARAEFLDRWAAVGRDLALLSGAPAVTKVFDLDATVGAVLQAAEAEAAARGLRFGSYCHPSPLGAAVGDVDALRTALTHLLGASIHLTQRGLVQCKVQRDPQSLLIDIVDESSGFAQPQLERWFADWDGAAHLPPAEGESLMGQSVVLARALVLRAGGRFDGRGSPDHGNRWTMQWPLVRAEADSPALGSPGAQAAPDRDRERERQG